MAAKLDVFRDANQIVLKVQADDTAEPTILRMPPALASQVAVAFLACSSDEELKAYFTPRASDMRRVADLLTRIMASAEAADGNTSQ